MTFSEAVTSVGSVTVTLETGSIDRTCTFTVSSSTTGTCNYTVQAGDTSSDLTVSSVTGTVEDAASNALDVPATPTTNLAANKALVVDTTAPSTPVATPDGGTFTSTQSVMLTSAGSSAIYYTTDGSTPTDASALYSSAISIASITTLKALGVDEAGNESSVMSESYVFSAPSSGGSSSESDSVRSGGVREETLRQRIRRSLSPHLRPASDPAVSVPTSSRLDLLRRRYDSLVVRSPHRANALLAIIRRLESRLRR